MPEENNNQPATPPINYEEHLDWFRVFVFIILPIQFIGNLYEFFQCIYDFNEYINTFFYIFSLFSYIVSIISIAIVFWASIKQKTIGYKVIRFYSTFIILYEIISIILIFFIVSNFLLSDIITALGFIIFAIINLIYFSHRKFLFGIHPEEPTTPAPEQEPKENHQ